MGKGQSPLTKQILLLSNRSMLGTIDFEHIISYLGRLGTSAFTGLWDASE